MASQNSAYSAGAKRCSGNTLEQAEETEGEMQQAGSGRGAAPPCSTSLSSSRLAAFSRCLFLPSWPEGEASGSNGQLMEET